VAKKNVIKERNSDTREMIKNSINSSTVLPVLKELKLTLDFTTLMHTNGAKHPANKKTCNLANRAETV